MSLVINGQCMLIKRVFSSEMTLSIVEKALHYT